MRVAQRLYEGVTIGGETVGLITYMRTDGVQMSGEAIAACRSLIERQYRRRYVPEKPRLYKTKAKNAQEAHEAIRPTDLARGPADVAAYLDADQRKLYALIWKRTLASQMESAVLDQVAVDIASEDRQVIFRATGSVDRLRRLPARLSRRPRRSGARKGRCGGRRGRRRRSRCCPTSSAANSSTARASPRSQHFTQPPPRFTEASLVKRLEELGIGRPSTYASILSVLQERKYVRLEAGASFRRIAAGWSRRSWRASSIATSPTASPPRWRRSSTTSPAAGSTGRACCATSGATSRTPSTAPRTFGSRRCWTRSTGCSARTSSARPTTAGMRAPARAAPTAGWASSSASSAPSSAARTIRHAATPDRWCRRRPRKRRPRLPPAGPMAAACSATIRRPACRSACARGPMVPTCSWARAPVNGERRRQAEADLAAARPRSRRHRSRPGAGPAVAAARAGRASGDRRGRSALASAASAPTCVPATSMFR